MELGIGYYLNFESRHDFFPSVLFNLINLSLPEQCTGEFEGGTHEDYHGHVNGSCRWCSYDAITSGRKVEDKCESWSLQKCQASAGTRYRTTICTAATAGICPHVRP